MGQPLVHITLTPRGNNSRIRIFLYPEKEYFSTTNLLVQLVKDITRGFFAQILDCYKEK